jgi:hypothetical protein
VNLDTHILLPQEVAENTQDLALSDARIRASSAAVIRER